MNRSRFACSALASSALASCLVACGGDPGSTSTTSTGSTSTGSTTSSSTGAGGGDSKSIQGGVEKGPFVLGSSIVISPLNADGTPTGQSINTQTTDDSGAFTVVVPDPKLSSIEGSGYYFNEVTGQLSTGSLTLRTYADLGAATESVHVNILTHLTHLRIQSLIANGATLPAATSQAELEVRGALGIGPAGFDPNAQGNDLTVLGGDSDATAYLFAVGAVLLQAAKTEAGQNGPVDATFQQLINTAASDFATSGTLPPATVVKVRAAERAIDVAGVMANLAGRFQSIGSTAAVPNLHRVLDPDEDDLPDIHDNCPYVANPDQADVNGNGIGDACECGNSVVDAGELCDDGNLIDTDGCEHDCVPTCELVVDLPLTGTPAMAPTEQVAPLPSGKLVLFNAPHGQPVSLVGLDPVTHTTTSLGANLQASYAPTFASNAASLGSSLYFSGVGTLGSNTWWKTDATALGTTDTGILIGAEITAFGAGLLLDDNAGIAFSDGTLAGTVHLAAGVDGSRITLLGSKAVFLHASTSFMNLWQTNGTPGGTALVKAISATSSGGTGSGLPLATGLGLAFFGFDDFATGSHQVWRTDGTSAGTFTIYDSALFGRPDGIALGTQFYFGIDTGGLWQTDGTAAGTGPTPIGVWTSPVPLGVAGGALIVQELGGAPALWRTDGTVAGTIKLIDLSNTLGQVTAVGNRLFFRNGFLPGALWVTDGTVAGTHAVAPTLSMFSFLPVATGGYVYFAADDGVHGPDPWRCKAAP